MPLNFIPRIEAPNTDSSESGLDFKPISYLGAVFLKVLPERIEETIGFLARTVQEHGTGLAVYLDVTDLPSDETVTSLLDAGASKVVISLDQFSWLRNSTEEIDHSRLILKLAGDHDHRKEIVGHAAEHPPLGLYCEGVQDVGFSKEQLDSRGDGPNPHVYVSETAASEQDLAAHVKDINSMSAIPIVAASSLTVDAKANSKLASVAALLQVKSDRQDGLFSTVVTDERGVALGLVYSSHESILESLKTGRGVYHSRKRGLWYKGESSGDVQELVKIDLDCDGDCLNFVVRQKGRGFCHLATATCFGPSNGLSRLQKTLQSRKESAPAGSYTARLFSSPQLLRAKILEEAEELCEAERPEGVAFEAADLIYFALTKCIQSGVSLEDVEKNLDAKRLKVKRRKGDAKGRWAEKEGLADGNPTQTEASEVQRTAEAPSVQEPSVHDTAEVKAEDIRMTRYQSSAESRETILKALQRPSQRSTDAIMDIVKPIITAVREKGDVALLEYTRKFEKAVSLSSPVLRAPFPPELARLPQETIEAIDISFDNIYRFHAAQKEQRPLQVETMPGIVCSRFCRSIERVGLYVPGGTAVLPSTALMLGVPALVAGCKKIVLASPPRSDGSVTPEIVYIARKIGAESIVLAGGAQAVAALAYGTESVSKVDKVLGPGNQFVTAAKMMVSNDTSAGVSIDMPAGPSEVLVVADGGANPAFVASDLLSQAEHGPDSQVVLIAVALSDVQLEAIERELHHQATALPRVEIVRGAINHSVTLRVKDIDEAMELSNLYAPEHLILQVADAVDASKKVENAGSVFIGPWTPESVGDYSAGVNHSLPTYGYAKQYSGVNLASYVKHITSSHLTAEGLKKLGGTVMRLAEVEGLDAHKRAVEIRLKHMEDEGI